MATKKKSTPKTLALEPFTKPIAFIPEPQQQIQVQEPQYPDTGIYGGYAKVRLNNNTFILKKQTPWRFQYYFANAVAFNDARYQISVPTNKKLFIERIYIHAAGITAVGGTPTSGYIIFENLIDGAYVQLVEYRVNNNNELIINFQPTWVVDGSNLYYQLNNSGSKCLTKMELYGFLEDN